MTEEKKKVIEVKIGEKEFKPDKDNYVRLQGSAAPTKREEKG